jgi:hypothetical protein
MDGNHSHTENHHTLFMTGWYDLRHHFHLLSIGLTTGAEAAEETSRALEVTSQYMDRQVGKPIPSDTSWIMDAAKGFRKGVKLWHTFLSTSKETEAVLDGEASEGEKTLVEVLIGMCYFHVGRNCVTNGIRLLPNGTHDKGQMLHDLDRLAGLVPHLLTTGWKFIEAEWEARDWGSFKDYFKQHWIEECPHWWVIALGLLTPRTNGGLEGCWPVVHRLLNVNRVGHAKVFFLYVFSITFFFALCCFSLFFSVYATPTHRSFYRC